MFSRVIDVLKDERGFTISIEYIGLAVVTFILAASIYNAVTKNTKSLHNGMVNNLSNITGTGF